MSNDEEKLESLIPKRISEQNPKLTFENRDRYEDAITQFKQQITDMMKRNTISEQVGNRLIVENEYSFFQQIIQVSYK